MPSTEQEKIRFFGKEMRLTSLELAGYEQLRIDY